MTDLKSALEAALFASGDSVPLKRLSLVLECDEEDVKKAAQELSEEYVFQGRGLRLLILNENCQMCSAPEYSKYAARVLEDRKSSSLSQPALEVLSIVAYYQPVTRVYIDRLRGIDSEYTVNMLCEKGLIEPCGRLDVPGRPVLYRTNETFLRSMGISSIDELPPLPELSPGEGTEKILSAIEELKKSNEDQLTFIPADAVQGR